MKMEKLTLQPISRITGQVQSYGIHPFYLTIIDIAMQITLPGSKSLSNRALLLAALAEGTTVVENLLDSADIRYMLAGLKKMNVVPTDINIFIRKENFQDIHFCSQIDVQDDKEKKTAIVVGNVGPISLENIDLDLGF